ncbi:hypothetical protein F4809DRAFT_591087 [Biscogniauxia mediterranea]|nr:hypothetical protein F4809DRAFT_591087 [Biscogniauxia mediterranea]
MDDEVEQFMMVTGVTSVPVARGYLEISGNDAMQAIQTFFDNPELQASFTATEPSSSANQPGASSSRGQSTRHTGREDTHGVIHIDSDDDDVAMIDNPHGQFAIPDDDDDDDAAAVARNAQEEEDAAMARRLQEELYGQQPGSGSGTGDDGVRAPIARTTEALMGPEPSWGLHDDREDAVLEQIRARHRPLRRNPTNPFDQSPAYWADPSAPPSATGARPGENPTSRSAMLANLFRPPIDLMSHYSWDEARDVGKDEKKWILVNLQDTSVFHCQALNRDIWKDDNIKALVREHFIFLQYDKQDPMAQDYIQFYFPNETHENQDNYPHVSIIDPRTGEQVKAWSGTPFPSAGEFYSDLLEFLDRYSLAANSKNPVPKSKPKAKQVDVGRLTEDEMLELALQNSLEANGGPSGSNVEDPDLLTKSSPDIDKGKGKAADEAVDVTGSSAQAVDPSESLFAQISSSNPHVEPANAPATTTRIQFKHPAGRVIRRFSITDPVRRIFEWLKASPLEGKEGVRFELKTMEGSRDLINELDKTIEEAGLKQGTVMIEYTED